MDFLKHLHTYPYDSKNEEDDTGEDDLIRLGIPIAWMPLGWYKINQDKKIGRTFP
jgi:hypothetical protein